MWPQFLLVNKFTYMENSIIRFQVWSNINFSVYYFTQQCSIFYCFMPKLNKLYGLALLHTGVSKMVHFVFTISVVPKLVRWLRYLRQACAKILHSLEEFYKKSCWLHTSAMCLYAEIHLSIWQLCFRHSTKQITYFTLFLFNPLWHKQKFFFCFVWQLLNWH